MSVVNMGNPGVRAVKTASHRKVFVSDLLHACAIGPMTISGAGSRDSGNTGDLDVLRPGLLMGLDSTTGLYQPSIIGVMSAAQVATDTSVTISAAQAVELVRRVGATGTVRFVGPPTAAGTVATFTETYSAVNTSTGVVTVSGLNADLIAGSFLCDNDGTYLPKGVIDDGYGIKVTDEDATSQDTPFPNLAISGYVDSSQILLWPSDTSLQAWVMAALRDAGGAWIFDHKLVV